MIGIMSDGHQLLAVEMAHITGTIFYQTQRHCCGIHMWLLLEYPATRQTCHPLNDAAKSVSVKNKFAWPTFQKCRVTIQASAPQEHKVVI